MCKWPASLIGLLALLACSAAAWQDPKSQIPAAETTAANRENYIAQNALQTLSYLKQSINDIDTIPDRVRVLLEIADSLWVADQEQAREVFRQSFARAVEFEDAVDDKQRKLTQGELRSTVITRIAKRDPSLADTLVRSATTKTTTQGADAFGRLYGRATQRSEALVQAASQMLESDAKKAAELASLAASEGLSQDLRLFLLKLRAKDSAAADALFEIAFQSAMMRHPKEMIEALFIWDYAFQRNTIYLGQVAWFRGTRDTQYAATLAVKKRVLAFAFDAVRENVQLSLEESETDAAVTRERNVVLHSVAAQILPDIEKYMPDVFPVLKTNLQKLGEDLNSVGRKPPTPPEPIPQSAAIDDSVNRLVERAVRAAGSQARDGLYARAVLKLYLNGEYERAIDLARKIDNSSLALTLTEPIKFDRSGELISRGELDSVADVARSIETLELRAAVLARLGYAYFVAKKPAQAGDILTEAQTVCAKANPTFYLGCVLLGIAQTLFGTERDIALQVTYEAFRVINAAKDGDPWDLLHPGDGLSGRLSSQNHSWTSRKDGGIDSVNLNYPRIGSLSGVLSKVSENDLDEGLALARHIKWRSQSYAVRAMICGQTLERARATKKVPPNQRTRSR